MNTGPLHILLVEDHAGDARLIELLLDGETPGNYRLDRTATLAATTARLETSRFDVILLDLQLPDSGGLETFLAVNALAFETPIIVLSGISDEDVSLEAVRQGAQDYLVKGTFDSNLAHRAIRYAIERHRLQSALRRMALLDPLTGLFNRRGFELLAPQQLHLAERRNLPNCLLMIDINGMKQINDRRGHAAGDRALRGVGEILRQTFRTSDIQGRIGGDEFVVLCFDVACPGESADLLNRRLQQRLAAWNSDNREFTLALSIGMAGSDPSRPADLGELFRLADRRMYRHKLQQQGMPLPGPGSPSPEAPWP